VPTTKLIDRIGETKLEQAIRNFYDQAFEDVLIGHFFFSKDKETLIRSQLTFAKKLAGDESSQYTGKPMRKAHSSLPLRNVHFNRRKVILEGCMEAENIPRDAIDEFLSREEKLRPLIVNASSNCNHLS